jgi:hypothetical protein
MMPPDPTLIAEVRRLMRARGILLRAVPEARTRSHFYRRPAEITVRLDATERRPW